MKKIISTLIVTAVSLTAIAQAVPDIHIDMQNPPRCGFQDVLNKAQVNYLDLAKAYRSNTANKSTETTDAVYDIPVVFHVVYGSARPSHNIPDSVILNQLDILNKAYRMQNSDAANARAVFQPLAGDAHIQFHLATIDPYGNPTTGITRTESYRYYFGDSDMDSMENIKYTSRGGVDPWPTDRYINIWIGNMADQGGQPAVLGYATPPLNPIPDNWPDGAEDELKGLVDGVVLQTHAVGNNSTLNAQLGGIYSQGRVAVHEVGHYLGLQHIFGANDPTAPLCGAIADDGVDDTPEQSSMSMDQTSTSSCPLADKNSCGIGSTGDMPDMWENYMDYSRDACQVMFTKGQAEIMRNVLGKQRASLTWPVSVKPVPKATAFTIYPNPASSNISVNFPGNISKVKVYNFIGQPVIEYGATTAGNHTYDISLLPAGNYMMTIESGSSVYTGRFSVSK